MVKISRIFRVRCGLLLACLLFGAPAVSLSQNTIPLTLDKESASALPYMDYLLDMTGQLDIHSLQSASQQMRFQPLNPKDIPRETGVVWLRMTLVDTESGAPQLGALRLGQDKPTEGLFLDLGEGIPSAPMLFVPESPDSTMNWDSQFPSRGNLFALPIPQSTPITMYVRVDGVPSIWFSPVLRTALNAATDLSRFAQPALVVMLAVVMLLCLLRGLTEKGQWRVWTSLFTATVLAHVLWGMPGTGKGYVSMLHLLAVILPGVALLLLAHVARHLTQSYKRSRIIDIQYLLLSLPGIAVALVPLIPGYAWTTRYIEFWPLVIALMVPTSLAAWLSGLPGARRFLLGCLLPPIGMIVAFMGGNGMLDIIPPSLVPAMPLWFVALSALIIATTAAPPEYTAEMEARRDKIDENMSKAMQLAGHDPNLRLVPTGGALPDDAQSPYAQAQQTEEGSTEKVLREYVDKLLFDVAALEHTVPAEARQHILNITKTTRDISHTLSVPTKERQSHILMGAMTENIFDLQSLLRQAHDSVTSMADHKNIALSWYMPPHLAQCYKGDSLHLLLVLRRLLESAVCATHRGAVQISVRRVPESVNPGHLLFTVSDSGTGNPPHDRSVTALTRAWELAGKSHGFLGVESGPHGANISFTVHYEVTTREMLKAAVEQEAEEAQRSLVILCSDHDTDRQTWAYFLEKMPLRIIEARTTDEAFAFYREYETDLLIFDGHMSALSLRQCMEGLRQYEQEQQLPEVLCLALAPQGTENDDENIFRRMGFQYILPAPITRDTLCAMLASILKEEVEITTLADEIHTNNTSTLSDTDYDGAHYDDAGIINAGMPTLELHPDQPAHSGIPSLHMENFSANESDYQDEHRDETEHNSNGELGILLESFDTHAESQLSDASESQHMAPEHAQNTLSELESLGSQVFGSHIAEPTRLTGKLKSAKRKSQDAHIEDTQDYESLASVSAQGNDGMLPTPEMAFGISTPKKPSVSVQNQGKGSSSIMSHLIMENTASSKKTSKEGASSNLSFKRTLSPQSLSEGILLDIDRSTSKSSLAEAENSLLNLVSNLREEGGSDKKKSSEKSNAAYLKSFLDVEEDTAKPETDAQGTAKKSLQLTSTNMSMVKTGSTKEHPTAPVPAHAIKEETDAPHHAEQHIHTNSPEESLSFLSFDGDKTEKQHAKDEGFETGDNNTQHDAQTSQSMEEDKDFSFTDHDENEMLTSDDETLEPLEQLINDLNTFMQYALESYQTNNPAGVAEAAANIALNADTYALRTLARMARTVESAAKAKDMECLGNILPDLETTLERTRIGLQQ